MYNILYILSNAEETGFEPARVLRLKGLANPRNGPAMRLLRRLNYTKQSATILP